MSQGRKTSTKSKDETREVECKRSVRSRDEDSVAEGSKLAAEEKAEGKFPVCTKTVTNEDLALECEICESWFHICCQEVTEAEYEFLTEHKSVHRYCDACIKMWQK